MIRLVWKMITAYMRIYTSKTEPSYIKSINLILVWSIMFQTKVYVSFLMNSILS